MLTICDTAVDEGLEEVRGTQIPELRWTKEPPAIGEKITRKYAPFDWQVIHVEAYQRNFEVVYLALIHPDHFPMPAREQWSATLMRNHSPSGSMSVNLSPDREWLGGGLDVNGLPFRDKQLYSYEPYYPEHPERTAMRASPTPWQIERADTYKPDSQESLFAAIHLCWCVQKELAAV